MRRARRCTGSCRMVGRAARERRRRCARCCKLCHAARGAGRGARRRHRLVGRRHAASLRASSVARQVQPDPEDRSARRAPRRCNPACAIWPSARRPRPTACTTRPTRRSQIACTIGGNVAENSGGVHCLKYGLTLHNVLRVRGCTIDGEPVEFGSAALDAPGLDLLAIVIGREGMLAVDHRGHGETACRSRSWPAASWRASTTSSRPAPRWQR